MEDNSIEIISSNENPLSSAMKDALKHHQELCADNTKNRNKYMQGIVNDLKDRNNAGHASVNELLKQEKCIHNFEVIRNSLKPNKSKGINISMFQWKILMIPGSN
jgi:hypothetical protein